MGLLLPRSFVARKAFEDRARRQQRAREVERITSKAIQAAYPEHLFTVEVNPDDGSIMIDHPLLQHSKARYFLPFARWDHGKGAVRLAGEILERVNVRRGELLYFDEYDGEAAALSRTQFSAR